MTQERGRSMALSLPRRLICDLLHFARKIPSVPVQRRIDVARLREARAAVAVRPSWCSLFLKAYGLVAAQIPQLRRSYLSWPCPRLYEHPFNVASVSLRRNYRGEDAVFFAHFLTPEQQSLGDLESHLRHFKEAPIESIGLFRRALAISRLPRPLRRLLWWVGLNVSGHKRARRLGTFGLSVYSALGAESLHPLSPLTTTLNYGVLRSSGSLDVRLVYDHRVLDGATVAEALALLQQVLGDQVLPEVRGLVKGNAA